MSTTIITTPGVSSISTISSVNFSQTLFLVSCIWVLINFLQIVVENVAFRTMKLNRQSTFQTIVFWGMLTLIIISFIELSPTDIRNSVTEAAIGGQPIAPLPIPGTYDSTSNIMISNEIIIPDNNYIEVNMDEYINDYTVEDYAEEEIINESNINHEAKNEDYVVYVKPKEITYVKSNEVSKEVLPIKKEKSIENKEPIPKVVQEDNESHIDKLRRMIEESSAVEDRDIYVRKRRKMIDKGKMTRDERIRYNKHRKNRD